MNDLCPSKSRSLIHLAVVLALGAVTTLTPGCLAPGQRHASSAAILAKRPANSASSAKSATPGATDVASGEPGPLVIEVSVGHSPAPAMAIDRYGALEKYVDASVRSWEVVQRRRFKPKQRAEYEASIRSGWSNMIAGEHFDRLNEIYHGMEAVTALRQALPGSRVYFSIGDDAEETQRARNFTELKKVQAPVLNRPSEWSPGLSPWVGHLQQTPAATAPAALAFVQDVNRAVDAQVALDSGGTYGRMLNVLGLGQLAGQERPFFVSSDSALGGPGAGKPWMKDSTMEQASPSAKQLKRARKRVKQTPYDEAWLAYWFGTAPSRAEWMEYQA